MQTNRDQIRAELIELANKTIDESDSYPVVLSEGERRVHLQWVNGEPRLVHFLSVDGVMPEKYIQWTDNYFE